MLSDVSETADLVVVWKGCGFEESFSRGQEWELSPSKLMETLSLLFKGQKYFLYSKRCWAMRVHLPTPLCRFFIGRWVLYWEYQWGIKYKCLAWTVLLPPKQWCGWLLLPHCPTDCESREEVQQWPLNTDLRLVFNRNNHWIFHLVIFNLCSLTLQKQQSPGPPELFLWSKHRRCCSGGGQQASSSLGCLF